MTWSTNFLVSLFFILLLLLLSCDECFSPCVMLYSHLACTVANGAYDVILHFAEIYDKTDEPGQRIFDVLIESTTVLDNFDITATAGPYTAVAVPISNVNVQDGSLDIKFKSELENAKLNGIEVLGPAQPSQPTPLSPTPPQPTPPQPTPPQPTPSSGGSVDIYINAGSTTPLIDGSGITWLADNYFTASSRAYGSQKAISGLADAKREPLYQVERFEVGDPGRTLTYNIPVPPGKYIVVLHWAEVYFGTSSARQFSVEVQGTPLFGVIDIFAQAGAANVLIKTTPQFNVASGQNVVIKFKSTINNGKINAIEVHSVQGPSTPTPPPPTPVAAPTPGGSFKPIYINAGAGQLTDGSGIIWQADKGFSSSNTFSTTSEIGGLSDPLRQPLYQTERWFKNFDYTFAVPSGPYFVTLHMAEVYVGK